MNFGFIFYLGSKLIKAVLSIRKVTVESGPKLLQESFAYYCETENLQMIFKLMRKLLNSSTKSGFDSLIF